MRDIERKSEHVALSVEPEQILVGADDLLAWGYRLRGYFVHGTSEGEDLDEMLEDLVVFFETAYLTGARVDRGGTTITT